MTTMMTMLVIVTVASNLRKKSQLAQLSKAKAVLRIPLHLK